MSAPTAHNTIVWPDPSSLQQWWTHVMDPTTPPDSPSRDTRVVTVPSCEHVTEHV